MKSILKPCWQGARFCTSCVWSFVVWTFWLILGVVLLLQVWWLGTQELAVPGFALRAVEQRLAASGLHATFGRTMFDPSGRVLVEDVRLFSPSFPEPLVTARALYLRLDPWALIVGQFEPRQFRAHGVEFLVPAMFSPTGRSEPLVRQLELTLTPHGHEIAVDQLTAQIGTLQITARGTVHTGVWRRERRDPLPIAEFIATQYPQLSRQIAPHVQQLAQLEAPQLHLEVEPSETHGGFVTATLLTRAVEAPAPTLVHAHDVRISTRFSLSPERPTRAAIDVHASRVSHAEHGDAHGLSGRLRGTFSPKQRTFTPEDAEIGAARVIHRALAVDAPVARVSLQLPYRGDLVATLFGEPVAIGGDVDLEKKTAVLHVDGRVAPGLLQPLAQRAQRDLHSLLSFETPPEVRGDIQLGPGWKLQSATGRISTGNVVARTVPLDAVSGRVSLAGTRFTATDIVLRQGENLARGTFTTDLAQRDFRFLLTGQLRPLGISGWFREWWSGFFSHFDFSAAVPTADVDVGGRWQAPHLTTVMISVEADSPAIRGVAFDEAQTLLFIRPNFFDGLDVRVRRDGGAAQGTFTRWVDLEAGKWRRMDFAVTSNLDLQESARVFGEIGSEIVAPFEFETPPNLRLHGTLDGPAAPDGPRHRVQVKADSVGAFSFFGFPLENLGATADVRDDNIVVDRVEANFAHGVVVGRAQLAGRGDERTLAFDCALHHGNLAEAITTVEEYTARRHNTTAPVAGTFLERAEFVRLDLAVSAEGRFNDLFSFHGAGNATLEGPELGKIRLLGLLSELLRFTSLSVNTARANFIVDGPRLAFSEVKLTGNNTAIDAKGIYALDRKELDFTAKVFPFAESRFFLKNIMDVVLTPLSQVLEVKLTGPLRNPSWGFLIGPTNILRTMTQAPSPEPRKSEEPTTPGSISPYLRR